MKETNIKRRILLPPSSFK